MSEDEPGLLRRQLEREHHARLEAERIADNVTSQYYDLTKKLEEALEREQEATQRLRALDEMKNAFLFAVSHDLRNPLMAIGGSADLLQRRREQLDADGERKLLAGISLSARRMQRIISSLLDLDRLTRGLVEPNREPTALAEFAAGLVAEIGVKEHQLEVDIPPDLTVEVDPVQLERILENLVANAERYTPAGTAVRIGAHANGDAVHITVEDHGPGVPDEEKEQIFELFSRGSGQARGTGTGIGLYLVARFAELHGGRAWVEDRPGGGARFVVRLPVNGAG